MRKDLECDSTQADKAKADKCRAGDDLFVQDGLEELVWVSKHPSQRKLEWAAALIRLMTPCGFVDRNAGDRTNDPSGSIWEMFRFRKLLEQKEFRKQVEEEVAALKAKGTPVPPRFENLLANAGDFTAFAEALRLMDTALVLASLRYLRALEPDFRAGEGRPSPALFVVSELPRSEPLAGKSFLDWLTGMLSAATVSGYRHTEVNGSRQSAVDKALSSCKEMGKQCDVVLEVFFEREGDGIIARAKARFVYERAKVGEIKSEPIPTDCPTASGCTAEQHAIADNKRLLVARRFLNDLSRQFAVVSHHLGLPEQTTPVRLVPAPDPNVALRVLGTPTSSERVELANVRSFACSSTCGPTFMAGLEARWTAVEKAPVCNRGSAVELLFEQVDTTCTLSVKVGDRRAYSISTGVDSPDLADAAGRNAGLALTSVLAGWRASHDKCNAESPPASPTAAASHPGPPAAGGDRTASDEESSRSPLVDTKPMTDRAPAKWVMVSPLLPWWIDHPKPAYHAGLVADGVVVGVTVLSGALTVLLRDNAETKGKYRPYADAGYTVTLTGASIAVLGRLLAGGVRLTQNLTTSNHQGSRP